MADTSNWDVPAVNLTCRRAHVLWGRFTPHGMLAMPDLYRLRFGLTLVALATCAGLETATQAADADTAALLQRISQLEARAGKVDQLTGRVEELEGHLAHLQEQLKTYEALPNQDAELRQAFIREEIERLLADAEQSTSSGYGEGVELGFWVWLTYLHDTGKDMTTVLGVGGRVVCEQDLFTTAGNDGRTPIHRFKQGRL